MKRFVTVMACGLLLGVLSSWAADSKIAVVDMGKLVKAHPDTAAADSLLEKQVDEYDAEQKDNMAEYDKLKKSFEDARKEAANKALNEDARDEKMKIAEDRLRAVQDHEMKMRETMTSRQKQLNDQKMRMQKRIVGKIKEVIAEYASKKDLVLVLDSAGMSVNGAEVVLYDSDRIDITDDILKIIAKSKPSDMTEDLKAKSGEVLPMESESGKPAAKLEKKADK